MIQLVVETRTSTILSLLSVTVGVDIRRNCERLYVYKSPRPSHDADPESIEFRACLSIDAGGGGTPAPAYQRFDVWERRCARSAKVRLREIRLLKCCSDGLVHRIHRSHTRSVLCSTRALGLQRGQEALHCGVVPAVAAAAHAARDAVLLQQQLKPATDSGSVQVQHGQLAQSRRCAIRRD
jgi:hypothetical protein